MLDRKEAPTWGYIDHNKRTGRESQGEAQDDRAVSLNSWIEMTAEAFTVSGDYDSSESRVEPLALKAWICSLATESRGIENNLSDEICKLGHPLTAS